jgi:cell division transport system permease protein
MRPPALMSGPDLWPDGGATRRLGLVVMTVLGLLTALALLAHVGASRAAGDWATRVTTEATALIRPRADESGATAAARAAEALAGVRGVREAVALERAEAEALLRPWLGEADLATLPLPQLVRLRLDPAEPASAISLNRALAEAGVDGTVDDHSLWRTDFVGAARGVQHVTLIAVLVAALLTATALVLNARQAVESRDGTLRALRLAGADDGALTVLAQWHLGRDAALAGAVGTGIAMAVGLAVALAPLTGTLGRIFPLILTDLILLAPWPLLMAVVAVIAARLSVRLWLGRQRSGG